MKKIMSLMLGLALLTGVVVTSSFAQTETEGKKKKKKKTTEFKHQLPR